ncbi:MAG TPA: hypothetical protein VMZ53_00970 [Kofleriaceae bacterium]|nr:hypothetical protein [Kofleriaceae bacterium]
MKRFALIALVAGCAGQLDGQSNPDANTSSDAPQGCYATLSYDPPFPVANTITPIRVAVVLSNVSGAGFTYSWTLTRNNNPVTYTQEASDNSAIGFFAPVVGKYSVSVNISGGVPSECSFASAMINVTDPNANNGVVRLRTVPSPTLAPPQETVIQIQGGGDYNRDIALDNGMALAATVTNGVGGPGTAAYVKLMPVSAPAAFTEVFASSTGSFSVRLLPQAHSVLVIPTSTSLAPKLLTWMPVPPVNTFAVSSGTLVTGNVLGPSGTGLVGAKVQLMAGVVPSTLGTTGANGLFSVRTDFPANTPITVRVTPPAGSGLPRLEATGTLNLQQSVQIAYASTLQTCNLGGNAVKRGGVNQANAAVTFVGALGTAGTATTGAMSVNLAGSVRVATTANGSGVLPTVVVPRSAALSAVVSLSATDWAVDTVDTSACAAQTIDAPAQITRTGVTKKDATTVLPGVRIEATPVDALAAADAQPVVVTSDSAGAFSIDLASGGTYDVRFIDPLARAAPLPALGIAPASVPATAVLPKALTISGKVTVTGTSNPIVGASIQILCAGCSGIDASRPIAQTATDAQSNYRIAVPDPGVM